MKTIVNISSIASLLLFPLGTLGWAAGSVSAPLNVEGACHGFECATSVYADVLRSGSAAVMDLSPTHFVLFGMALIVLRVVGKRLGRD
ncbi:MAG: hypothetical protein ACREQO_23140 [Candidatus Binatia bacterium]